jgi:peptidoglycan hydrolase-like protein with peptidoglycan-binding domain
MRLLTVIAAAGLAILPSVAIAAADTDLNRQVQQALIRQGAQLKADGRFGPASRSALQQFQRKSGLPPTGKIDSATLDKLKIARPVAKKATKAEAPAKAEPARPLVAVPGKVVERQSGAVNTTKIVNNGKSAAK